MSASLDLITLRLFLAVVEEQSMAKAAEREHISTPAISKRILELESQLNVQLLERSNTGVKPTVAGRSLANDTRAILNALDVAQCKLSDYSNGVRGDVRVSANPTSIFGSLPREIQAFVTQYPLVHIALDERPSVEVAQALVNGDTDIGIFFPEGDYPQLEVVPYRAVQLCLIAPSDHPLSRRRSLELADAAEFNFVLQSAASRMARLVVDAATRSGFKPRCNVHSATQEGMRRLVEAGMGVAVMAEQSALPYAKLHKLRCIRISEKWAQLQTSLATRKSEALSMSARLLLSLLKAGSIDTDHELRTRR